MKAVELPEHSIVQPNDDDYLIIGTSNGTETTFKYNIGDLRHYVSDTIQNNTKTSNWIVTDLEQRLALAESRISTLEKQIVKMKDIEETLKEFDFTGWQTL